MYEATGYPSGVEWQRHEIASHDLHDRSFPDVYDIICLEVVRRAETPHFTTDSFQVRQETQRTPLPRLQGVLLSRSRVDRCLMPF